MTRPATLRPPHGSPPAPGNPPPPTRQHPVASPATLRPRQPSATNTPALRHPHDNPPAPGNSPRPATPGHLRHRPGPAARGTAPALFKIKKAQRHWPIAQCPLASVDQGRDLRVRARCWRRGPAGTAVPAAAPGRRRGRDRGLAATMSPRCCAIAGFSGNVVPLLSPGQQLRDDVAAENRAQQQLRDDVAALHDQKSSAALADSTINSPARGLRAGRPRSGRRGCARWDRREPGRAGQDVITAAGAHDLREPRPRPGTGPSPAASSRTSPAR